MIELIVIRHAIAEGRGAVDRQGDAIPDEERRLTQKGRSRMTGIAKGLQCLYPALDVVASSPLVRAVQTAEIVSEAYGGVPLVRIGALEPQTPGEGLVQWLADQPHGTRVAVVGHEPHLSAWCSWMLSGRERAFLAFKKGAACLMTLPLPVAPGEAQLVWFATPRHLRRLQR